MKIGDLKTLAKNTKLRHWQWASKDELVTLLTETDPARIKAAKTGIETKHAAWLEKNGGKKKFPAPEPAKSAPTPKPTQPSPPVFYKKGEQFEETDAAWIAKGKSGNFTSAGKAQVGGAHSKQRELKSWVSICRVTLARWDSVLTNPSFSVGANCLSWELSGSLLLSYGS
jgi:hypothetical protein